MEGERGVGVVEVSDPDVVDGLGVVQLLQVRVVRQPRLVPVVDAVEVARVVQAVVAWENRRVEGGVIMNTKASGTVSCFPPHHLSWA